MRTRIHVLPLVLLACLFTLTACEDAAVEADSVNECAVDNGGCAQMCTDEASSFTCSCEAGYELAEDGRSCGNIDDCVDGACLNGGECVDGVESLTCECAAGFEGESCETDIDHCADEPCLNGGECTDGVASYTCTCAAGFFGVNCETNIDDCASNPCQNGGVCVDGANSYTCECVPGYEGQVCETNVDDCVGEPCLNGGVCVDGLGSYTCECALGFEGESCETDIDDCVGEPCLNGGVCVDGANSYTCECAAGFEGESCETDIDECAVEPCLNGGVCVDGAASYTCECVAGYEGETCETDIDECAGMDCGVSTIDGETPCGTCNGTDYCLSNVCTDACEGLACGPSPINGTDCGSCLAGEFCSPDGTECGDACAGLVCGSSPYAPETNCGSCPAGLFCSDGTECIEPTTPKIAAGMAHSCAVDAGVVTCWGGEGSYSDTGNSTNVGQLDPPEGMGTCSAIVANINYTCCKMGNTESWVCWGDDTGPKDVPSEPFVQVALGGVHGCGLRPDGSIDCWGAQGNFDDGMSWDLGQLSAPPGTYIQVTSGRFHSCGLRTDGSVQCWGYDELGGTVSGTPAGSFLQIAAGWFHTCGVKTDGSVACWGIPYGYGESAAPGGTFQAVDAGRFHSCGLKTDGTITCWGGEADGKTNAPTGTFVDLELAGYHSLATREDGTIACWGYTDYGACNVPAPWGSASCSGLVCGTSPIDGSFCGSCSAGTICSEDQTTCLDGNEMGEFCGIIPGCTPEIPNPQNPAEMIENPAYPNCMHDQCKSKFCLNAGAPGAYVYTYPVCSLPCEIYLDVKNNKTGGQGADGVEDTDAPISDCDGAFEGPAGSEYTCVNFAPPEQSSLAYCLPGTNFEECGADSDCPVGEGCTVTGIGGSPNSRCFTKKVEGDWGQIADLGDDCNSNPFEDGVSWCESGICFGLGCVEWCKDNTDCDTIVGDDTQGCDQGTGTCMGWDSKECTTDLDCSTFTCGEPQEIFSNFPEYTPTLCWPHTCEIEDDCPPGNYCRFYWNGEPHPDAGWDNLCLAEVEGGAGLGEACDSDPNDNIPGDTCANEDLCFGGFCSALCAEHTDCNMELDQKCTVTEYMGDYDDDGETDYILPLERCLTYPDMTDTMCWSEATCGDTETCTVYEVEKDGADGSMYTMEGFCSAASTDKGSYGKTCGVPGAAWGSCKSGWCMGSDADTGQVGYCTQVCESHTECAQFTVAGTTYKGRCQALLYNSGGDLFNPNTNNYVSVCLATSAESSMQDCADDFMGCPAGEACLPQVIGYGPDYASKTDYLCMSMANQDASLPTGTLGDWCNPNLEDAEGYAINQCADGYCLDDTSIDSGYCTNLCDPDNDTCAADGLPGMSCQKIITQPRSGAYESNAGGFWMCQKDDGGVCSNTCEYANDGECDDSNGWCPFCTDCVDCGNCSP